MKKRKRTGVICMIKSGHAYLKTKDEDDIFIHRTNLANAMDGDEVVVKVVDGDWELDWYQDCQGIVSEIKKRNKTEFSGVVKFINKKTGFARVSTLGDKTSMDFSVSLDDINGAVEDDVVSVHLVSWNNRYSNPIGVVNKIFGKNNTHEAEMGIIMNKFEIDSNFPEEVMKEVEEISEEITDEEIGKRRDLRGILTFTIDGSDARDLDDALSFDILDNGNYEIGVNIADVGHYVKKDSAIDKESLNRGTSIYLVDRCLPMLPEKLSNHLCSLNPNTDKLTVSVIFEITPEGEIKNHTFKKTIINSNFRFTYDEVQEMIENNKDKSKKELKSEEYAINVLDRISKIMRAKRFEMGSVNFNSKEPKFIFDENKAPIDVCFSELKDSNQLIEELMLLANRYAGTFLYKNKIPAAFRVHDSPDTERLKELSLLVKQFGYELNIDDNIESVKKSLNKLLSDSKNTPEGNMISTLAVRCMAKAEQNVTNIGHYGLGDDFMPPNAYAWFTSGIRRYADILNQRQLFDFL